MWISFQILRVEGGNIMMNIDMLRRDEFDSCIVGVTTEPMPRLVYSYNDMITYLMNENKWTFEEAESYTTSLMLFRRDDIVVIHTLAYIS